MPRPRPTAVTIIGISNIVFGGLGVLCGLCGISAYALGGAVAGRDLVEHMNQRIPGWYFWEVGKIAVGLLLSILLIVAGIGLLNMRKWGRVLSFVYAILTLPLQVGYVLFQFLLAIPVAKEF